MRASSAGLILTPHRTTELGGPTSFEGQEARPLGWLPILELSSTSSHGGATGGLPRAQQRKTKGRTGRTRGSDKIPYFLSFPRRRINYKTPPLGWTISVLVRLLKKRYTQLFSCQGRFQANVCIRCPRCVAVTETDDEANPPARKTAPASDTPRPFTQSANHRAGAVAGRRQGT